MPEKLACARGQAPFRDSRRISQRCSARQPHPSAVYDCEDVLVLEIDVDLAGDGIVLWHSSFAIKMQRLDYLVLLNINNGLCLPPLIGNIELVEGSGIRTAVGLSFR